MSQSLYNTPILWINNYLKEKLEEELGFDNRAILPFFPTQPATLELLQSSVVEDSGVMAVWDRMFRMRRRPFPHIKQEQVLYYFYTTGSDYQLKMIRLQEAVMRWMDREDETAEEINEWAKQKGFIEATPGEVMTPNYYFHRFRVYHLEEARDIVDFGTARTYAGNKIIIEYEYHMSDDPNSKT